MSPVSSGSRSASRTRAGNSGASSRKSTPPWAREIAPGRATPEPPPTIAAVEAVWCGFSNGARRSSPASASKRRSSEWIAETVKESSADSSGRIPGRREAIIVLPVPGGPSSRRWCSPAAATSAARRACACPTTSAKSPTGGVWRLSPVASASGGDGRLGGGGGTSAPKQCRRVTRWSTPSASIPSTSRASGRFSPGTTARVRPCARAARRAGSTPGTGRSLPSSPSSPSSTRSPGTCWRRVPCASRTAIAIARSKPEPCLGCQAGVRLTVIRRWARCAPLRPAAARTRSRDWRVLESGRPTSAKEGRPWETSASTSTRVPSRPSRLTEGVRAWPISGHPAQMLEGDRAVEVDVEADDVDAHVAVRGRVLHEVLPHQASQAAQLLPCHGGLRHPGHHGAARLHLEEHECGAVEGDDVELALAQSEIPLDDLPASGGKALCGELLPRLAELPGGHLPHPVRAGHELRGIER